MNTTSLVIAAAVGLTAAFYAQREIPRFTASARAALFTRVGLFVLGLTFGYVAADNLGDAGMPPLLTFLLGFGAVHVPAAFILLIKRAGAAGKS